MENETWNRRVALYKNKVVEMSPCTSSERFARRHDCTSNKSVMSYSIEQFCRPSLFVHKFPILPVRVSDPPASLSHCVSKKRPSIPIVHEAFARTNNASCIRLHGHQERCLFKIPFNTSSRSEPSSKTNSLLAW